MARKKQRKKKKQGVVSTNLVVPFSRFHSDKVRVNKKEQRRKAKEESKELE